MVDQSGSMDIDVRTRCARSFAQAPHALVIGYSHRPGDRGMTPNCGCSATEGVATDCPSGNVGNGVDGPVLLWALNTVERASRWCG